MNEVDASRLDDTTKGAVVVNLAEYREQAGTRKTAAPYLDSGASDWGLFALAIFVIVVALMLFRRA